MGSSLKAFADHKEAIGIKCNGKLKPPNAFQYRKLCMAIMH